MAPVLRFHDGNAVRLDRNLTAAEVAATINTATARLVPFPDDRTPSRTVYVDPLAVMAIEER